MSDRVLRVLIIDDDEVDRLSIKRAITSSNMCAEFIEADSVNLAFKYLEDRSFDVALIDYQLPDGDGLSVIRTMREREIDTAVIVLTGRGDEQLVMEMIKAGASDYIPKGKLSSDVLCRSINNAIRIRQAEVEKRVAEDKLIRSNQRIENILESITDAFFAVNNDWEISYVNNQAGFLFEHNVEGLVGESVWEVLGSPPSWFKEKFFTAMQGKVAISVEGFYDCLQIWLDIQIYPSKDGLSVYFRDISSRKETEARLNYLATHDILTDLPNRMMLMDRLTQSLTRVLWHKRSVAVLFLDVDRFKHINDTFGHSAGDELLRKISERLRACVRSGDTVARLGGDEFVIVLQDLAHQQDVVEVAEKLLASMSQPIQVSGNEVVVTTSIGVSLFPNDGDSAETLLRNADTAMYRAKSSGRDNYQMYSPSMTNSETERMTMESHLRKALENHEFVLNYQPMIDTRTGQITRVEALLRWDHPNLGIIPPLDFLPLAEEIGLIEYIGEWVIREACAQCKEWQNKGYTDLYMTVNISDREFRAQRFIDQLEEVVKDQGISKNYLEFELTEKIVVQDFEASISKLNRLREMGIKLALDDFGTGYSSLAYLKKLPLNTLKIDRSFVADVDESPEGTSIVASIIALAHTLNMYVVAEGVETEKQYQMLKSQGCDALQGYHISPPVPAKELLGLLKKYGVAPASRIA